MKSLKSLLILSLMLFVSVETSANPIKPIQWEIIPSTENVSIGDEIELIFNFKLDNTWYLYSNDFSEDVGPTVTAFSWIKTEGIELIGDVEPIHPKRKYDDIFGGEVSYFLEKGQFIQKARVTAEILNVVVEVDYQVCTTEGGKCIPFTDEFVFDFANSSESQSGVSEAQAEGTASSHSFGEIFSFAFLAFLAGLAALITPCVFPMIPMTVTFFTKSSGTNGFRNALLFGFSIVAIYTIAGTIVAWINGPEFANWLSTHWVPNVFFFLVFVIFALSFLGMFEITLPHGLVNRIDRKADKGGLIGVFFMAFTLVLVSFSCTGPIVGTILVASAGGEVIKPIAGMLAFSMALALPFTLFALFPKWLSNLPKSGGWLNTVKVVLGFLELALGLKFLSVADQVYHWGILDREIYLALWIVIFSMLGFYLLGKLRTPHDSPMEKVGVPRLILSIMTFAFVVYLIPGMVGAPLKSLAGYLPPMTSHDYNLAEMVGHTPAALDARQAVSADECGPARFGEFLQLPHGIQGYFEIDQALACAKAQNKPLFIDFTGHGCVNCREMEARVWSDPAVLKKLHEEFVVVALYVDDKKELPDHEWYISRYDGKQKRTIGKKNADYQIAKFNTNAQPYYVLMNPFTEEKLVSPKAYDLDIDHFIDFLEAGADEFNRQQQISLLN